MARKSSRTNQSDSSASASPGKLEAEVELVEWNEGATSVKLTAEVEAPINGQLALVGDTLAVGGGVELPGDAIGVSLGIELNLKTGEITGGGVGLSGAGFEVSVYKSGDCTSLTVTYLGVGFSFEHCGEEEEEEEPVPTPEPTPEPTPDSPIPPFDPWESNEEYSGPVLVLIAYAINGVKQELPSASPNYPIGDESKNFYSDYYRNHAGQIILDAPYTRVLFPCSLYDGTPGPSGPVSVYNNTGMGENDPPRANNDWTQTPFNTPVSFNIIANDTDYDGTITGIDLNIGTPGIETNFASSSGYFQVDSSGILTFSPSQGFEGITSLTYQVFDNEGGTGSAEITIVVDPKPPTPTTEPTPTPTPTTEPTPTPTPGNPTPTPTEPDYSDYPIIFYNEHKMFVGAGFDAIPYSSYGVASLNQSHPDRTYTIVGPTGSVNIPFGTNWSEPLYFAGRYLNLFYGSWGEFKSYARAIQHQWVSTTGEHQTIVISAVKVYSDKIPKKESKKPPTERTPPHMKECCDELKAMLVKLQKSIDSTNGVLGTEKFKKGAKVPQSEHGIAHWFLKDKNALKYPDPNHIEGEVDGQKTGTNGWLKNWVTLESTDYFELIRYLVESNIRLEILFPIAELADIKHKDKLPKIPDNLIYPLGSGDKKTVPNLIYLQEVLFKYLNNQLGAMPISVSLAEGTDESLTILNQSEAIKHILQFLWDKSKDDNIVIENTDVAVDAGLRNAQAIAQIQYLLVQVKALCLAIAEDLDFEQKQEVVSYPSSIDPYAGKWKAGVGFDPESLSKMKDDEVLAAMLNDADVSVKVIKNKETKTLRRHLNEIRNHTQVLQAQAIKATPEALEQALEAQKLINTVDELLDQRNMKKAFTQGRGRSSKRKKDKQQPPPTP